MKKIKNIQGNTLIELLLYVSLVGIMLLSITAGFYLFMESRVKTEAISEVEQQGQQIIQTITQTIRNAQAITSPTAGNSANTIILDVVDNAVDPTTFQLNTGTLQIVEALNPAINLTSSQVNVSSLTFRNLTPTGSPGVVRIELTLNHVNPSGRPEGEYQQSFYATASLKNN